MTRREHIKNILKDVYKGKSNEGEDFNSYLNRRVDQVMSYLPGHPIQKEDSQEKKK